MVTDLHRSACQVHMETVGTAFFFRHGRPDRKTFIFAPGKDARMRRQAHLRAVHILQQIPQAASMIVVAMGQHDIGYGMQVNPECLRIPQKHIRVSGVKENPAVTVFQIKTECRLAEIIPVDDRVVVGKNSQFHFARNSFIAESCFSASLRPMKYTLCSSRGSDSVR